MFNPTWSVLADTALAGALITRDQARAVLEAPPDDLLGVLDAAFRVRRAHWGRRVSLHVLENAKLGGPQFRGSWLLPVITSSLETFSRFAKYGVRCAASRLN